MNKKDIVEMFIRKEAISSIRLDKCEDLETVSSGLTNNKKLFKIKVKIICKRTGKVVWEGSMAHASRAFRKLRSS